MLAAACGGAPSDADLYRAALVEAEAYEEAEANCRRVVAPEARGDCLVAAMEAWNRLDEADCAGADVPRWHDECLFLLAERRRAAGDLGGAIDTCHRTAFRRSCAWHLLQDEVEASLAESPRVAEARLAAFVAADPLPDAPVQFWIIRFREGGGPVDEGDCAALADRASCERAVWAVVRALLDASAQAGLARVCAANPGERVTRRGAPAWKRGPVADEAEERWVGDRCSGGKAPPRRVP